MSRGLPSSGPVDAITRLRNGWSSRDDRLDGRSSIATATSDVSRSRVVAKCLSRCTDRAGAMASAANERHVWSGVDGGFAGQARIVGDLDLAAERREAGTSIE